MASTRSYSVLFSKGEIRSRLGYSTTKHDLELGCIWRATCTLFLWSKAIVDINLNTLLGPYFKSSTPFHDIKWNKSLLFYCFFPYCYSFVSFSLLLRSYVAIIFRFFSNKLCAQVFIENDSTDFCETFRNYKYWS